jgi:isocitrate lyase
MERKAVSVKKSARPPSPNVIAFREATLVMTSPAVVVARTIAPAATFARASADNIELNQERIVARGQVQRAALCAC